MKDCLSTLANEPRSGGRRDTARDDPAYVSEDFFVMDCLSTLAKEPRSGGQPSTVRSDHLVGDSRLPRQSK
jgi:hypothetical protein